MGPAPGSGGESRATVLWIDGDKEVAAGVRQGKAQARGKELHLRGEGPLSLPAKRIVEGVAEDGQSAPGKVAADLVAVAPGDGGLHPHYLRGRVNLEAGGVQGAIAVPPLGEFAW